MSEATVVSLLPFELNESKPGIIPPRFIIPAAPRDGFSILHVVDARERVEDLLSEQPRAKFISIPAFDLAKAIVGDFYRSQMGCTEDAYPGLFWVEGKLSVPDVQTRHAPKLAEMRQIQTRWLRNLVLVADDLWREFGKHNVITDTMRKAAEMLDLDRTWLLAAEKIEKTCPVCRSEINETAIICPNCRAILDPDAYKKFTFANG